MADLRVPIAIDTTRRYVEPHDDSALPTFWCAECDRRLSIRGGGTSRVRRHFFHVAEPEGCGFGGGGEGPLHAEAKHRVIAAVRAALNGGPPVWITRSCEVCETPHRHPVLHPAFGVTDVRDEYRHMTKSGFAPRADVALLDEDGRPVLFIEVWDSHRVDSRKEAALDVRWIELGAQAVVDDPQVWTPVRSGNLDVLRCACRGHRVLSIVDNGWIECPIKEDAVPLPSCCGCRFSIAPSQHAEWSSERIICGAPQDLVDENRRRIAAKLALRARRRQQQLEKLLAEQERHEHEVREAELLRWKAVAAQQAAADAEHERLLDEQRRAAEKEAAVREEQAAAHAAREEERRAAEWDAWFREIGAAGDVLALTPTAKPPTRTNPDEDERLDLSCPWSGGMVHHAACRGCDFFLARITKRRQWSGVLCGHSSNTMGLPNFRAAIHVDDEHLAELRRHNR